jgi:hypothetical protein
MQRQRSEWDLLCYLAQMEQFAIYFDGRVLRFEPLPSKTDELYVLQVGSNPFSFNGMNLRFYRDLTVAKGVQVTVQSFSQRDGRAVLQKYPKKAGKHVQSYMYQFANLNDEQAAKKAQSLHKEFTLHEVKMHADIPADNILTARNVIKVIGSAFDQIYYPDSISRSMSRDGYDMIISAKNRSPSTERALE